MEPLPGLHAHVVGARLRRHEDGARPRHAGGSFRGCRRPRWSSATCTPKRASRSRRRRAGCCSGRSSARGAGATSSRPRPSSSSTCFRESFDEARAKRYQDLTPVSSYLEDYHILQTSKEEPLVRAIRNRMEAARVPVEFSKGEWGRGPGGDQPPLRRGPRDGRPPRALQARRQGDRLAAGLLGDVHGEVRHGRGRLVLSTCTPRCGTAAGARRSSPAARARARARRSSSTGWPGRWRWRASSRTSTRPTSTPTSATRPARFAPTRIAAGWDNRTCGFRLCGEGAGFRVENRIPGADANPYLAFAATIAAGLHGDRAEAQAARALRGQRVRGRQAPPGAQDAARGDRRARALARSRARRFGDRVVDHYLHSAGSSSRPSTRPSPTGS